FVVKGGRINEQQMEFVRSTLCSIDDNVLKMVVTHHPFDLPESHDASDIVGRAGRAMPLIAGCGGDVFLSGHMHVSHIDTTSKRYRLADGHVAIIVHAGTATSTRVRGEPHSFNLIEFERPELTVIRFECNHKNTGFQETERKMYCKTTAGWERNK